MPTVKTSFMDPFEAPVEDLIINYMMQCRYGNWSVEQVQEFGDRVAELATPREMMEFSGLTPDAWTQAIGRSRASWRKYSAEGDAPADVKRKMLDVAALCRCAIDGAVSIAAQRQNEMNEKIESAKK